MAESPRSVELSRQVYELLINAYPESFRREYANEMTQVFRDLATDAVRQRGELGLITAWFRVLGDLVSTAPREHLSEFYRRIEMKTAASAVFSFILAAFVYNIALGLTGIGLWAIDSLTAGAVRVAPPNSTQQLIMVYLPALLTGAVLMRVKPFFLPMVTVPLAATALVGSLAFLDGGVPWWAATLFAASVGLLSLVGCVAVAKMSSRWEKPCAV